MDKPNTCHETAEQAETAFYRAFERADIQEMMAVWANSEEIVCIHPMGKAQRGRQAVEEGWLQIFSSGQRMHFEVILHQDARGESLVTRTVQENIYLHGESRPRPPMLATNVYQLTPDGWRIILHHASPAVLANSRAHGREESPPVH